MSNKNWYAVITADVLYDNEITARQKLLIAVISNLSNAKGYCFASNAKLAEYTNTSVRTLQRDLETIEGKYINRVTKLKSNGEVEFRALTPVYVDKTPMSPMSPPVSVVTPPHDTHDTTPHVTSVIHNNKETNNKYNTPEKEILLNQVEQIYEVYPNKCPIKNRPTDKGSKNKEQIQTLIKNHGFEYVMSAVRFEVSEKKKSSTWLRNFSTLLNNLPEAPNYYAKPRVELKFNTEWMDNNGNTCADYIGEDGKVHSLNKVDRDADTNKFYLKQEYV